MLSANCHAHRLASACCYTAVDLYSVRKCESTLMQSWKCFAVSPLQSACLEMHETIVQWRQKVGSCSAYAKQGSCRVRQLWELGVRFWLFGQHWNSCEKQKVMHRAFFTATCKKKNFIMVLSFCQHCYLSWQNWAKFFWRDVLT